MKEIVLITGAGGMVAQQLANQLKQNYSIRFLTRKPNKNNEFQWDIRNNKIDPDAFKDVNHIIHLAGTSVAKKRWTKKRKDEIISSRVDGATLIQQELIKQGKVIDSFISASAIGFYGNKTTNKVYSEDDPSGSDFLSTVCQKWELAAQSFKISNVAKRVSILRIGMVLSPNGGVLQNLMPLTKFYLGAAFGNGKQYNPWIHIEDLCNMIEYILNDKSASGTFNAVAPEHSTNKELITEIAKAMNRKVILPNIPKFTISLLLGEMSKLFLEGNKVSSEKIRNLGFKFEYPKLKDALENLLNN